MYKSLAEQVSAYSAAESVLLVWLMLVLDLISAIYESSVASEGDPVYRGAALDLLLAVALIAAPVHDAVLVVA